MTNSSLLERTLAANLTWNTARIKFLAAFLIALTQTRSVNLVRLSAVFGSAAKPSSSYKRIQRFLRFFELPFPDLARLLVKLMKLTPPFILVIDRTEWKFGSVWHNVLTLAIVSDEVAIPILWRFLKRKGCSDDGEREELMRAYLRLFPLESIGYVCADREFASERWVAFLTQEKIGFRLRIKANHTLTDKHGKAMKARKLLQTARVGEAVICRRWRKLWGKYRVCAGGSQTSGRRTIDPHQQRAVVGNDRRIPAQVANRNVVRLFEVARLRFGGKASKRVGAIGKTARITSLSDLLVVAGGRENPSDETDRYKKARTPR